MRCFICGRGGHKRSECPGLQDDRRAQSVYGSKYKKNSLVTKKAEMAAESRKLQTTFPSTQTPFFDCHCDLFALFAEVGYEKGSLEQFIAEISRAASASGSPSSSLANSSASSSSKTAGKDTRRPKKEEEKGKKMAPQSQKRRNRKKNAQSESDEERSAEEEDQESSVVVASSKRQKEKSRRRGSRKGKPDKDDEDMKGVALVDKEARNSEGEEGGEMEASEILGVSHEDASEISALRLSDDDEVEAETERKKKNKGKERRNTAGGRGTGKPSSEKSRRGNGMTEEWSASNEEGQTAGPLGKVEKGSEIDQTLRRNSRGQQTLEKGNQRPNEVTSQKGQKSSAPQTLSDREEGCIAADKIHRLTCTFPESFSGCIMKVCIEMNPQTSSRANQPFKIVSKDLQRLGLGSSTVSVASASVASSEATETDLSSSIRLNETLQKFVFQKKDISVTFSESEVVRGSDRLWFVVGVEPQLAGEFTEEAEQQIMHIATSHPRCVGLYSGIDYGAGAKASPEEQKNAFERMIRLAESVKKPLQVYLGPELRYGRRSEAENDFLEVLEAVKSLATAIPMHLLAYSGTGEFLFKLHKTYPNIYFGFNGVTTYRKAEHLLEPMFDVPLNRLLLDSTAPLAKPSQLGSGRDDVCHPGMCVFIAERIAQEKKISTEELISCTTENVCRLYEITPPSSFLTDKRS